MNLPCCTWGLDGFSGINNGSSPSITFFLPPSDDIIGMIVRATTNDINKANVTVSACELNN